MRKSRLIGALLGAFFLNGSLSAQDDLLKMLEEERGPTTEYAFATFKGTRVINLHSPQLPGKGVLQYMFLHRFGAFNNEFFYNFLGMSNAEVRLQLDYSFTDWLNFGMGHGSAAPRTYDTYVKYRLLRQSKGARNFPVTVVGYSAFYYTYQKTGDIPVNRTDRMSFVNELIIARKFTPKFSMELVPSHVHFNQVSTADESNDIFALGAAARMKVSKAVAISLEYIHQFNPLESRLELGTPEIFPQENKGILSMGVDIETGGHVFQLFLTNSQHISDPYIITQTPGSWGSGDIHFGFNISRVFTIVRPKEYEGE